MHRPTTSLPAAGAMVAGPRGPATQDPQLAQHGDAADPAHAAAPLQDSALQALRSWLCGTTALPPAQAERLLRQAVRWKQLIDEPALHWRAVKAHIAGIGNWSDMGFKLILD